MLYDYHLLICMINKRPTGKKGLNWTVSGTYPGPESQDELSPLTVAHQLWDQLRHHGNKLL